jgi:hypothetical protein
MRKLPVGESLDIPFEMQDIPENLTPAVLVTASDVDSVDEMHLFLNGVQIAMGESIVHDTAERTEVIPFKPSLLQEGKNTIRILFNSNLNETTSGFEVHNIRIIFMK